MRITSLRLEQFRSFPLRTFDFTSGGMHLLTGPNGIGKTNIIEAIAVLSRLKSFLPIEDEDMIAWGEAFYRVRVNVVSDRQEEGIVEVVSQVSPRRQRACFRNDVRVPALQVTGFLPSVTFLPHDLALFTGSPSLRRSFLDDLLCQVAPPYDRALSAYMKILKQRNALLKKIADGLARAADLLQWDMMLSEQGSFLTVRRLELIEMLQCALPAELKSLGEKWEEPRIRYIRKGSEREQTAICSELLALLEKERERDIMLALTTTGPHRDDWDLCVNGRSLSTFASRGQQRTAVLALLFIEVSFLELQRGEKPVVLLDDVFSELDEAHQERLLSSFGAHQVFLTATHLPARLPPGARILDIEGLKVGEGFGVGAKD
ncbi:MAG: DNA replication and repair protein RecF [Candidatus Peregrinibacteria bacterium]